MNIDDLIAALEELRDEHGGDCEVRLATQPNWPFEYSIAGLVASPDVPSEDGDEDDDDRETISGEPADDESHRPIIFICEGTQLGYANKRIWDAL